MYVNGQKKSYDQSKKKGNKYEIEIRIICCMYIYVKKYVYFEMYVWTEDRERQWLLENSRCGMQ